MVPWRLADNGRRAPAALAPAGIKRMIGKEKSRLGAAIRLRRRPQGKIKTISRTNPPPGKALRSRYRHSARPDRDPS
jgi:hypothetical protein